MFKNLKKLFLIDGLGALISAFLLGVVLVKFESLFGIPKPTLYILAAIPIFFALYDFFCYFRIKKNLPIFLKGIALMNILYCCLSLCFAFHHSTSITALGWAYIIIEIVIVVGIAIFELRVART